MDLWRGDFGRWTAGCCFEVRWFCGGLCWIVTHSSTFAFAIKVSTIRFLSYVSYGSGVPAWTRHLHVSQDGLGVKGPSCGCGGRHFVFERERGVGLGLEIGLRRGQVWAGSYRSLVYGEIIFFESEKRFVPASTFVAVEADLSHVYAPVCPD